MIKKEVRLYMNKMEKHWLMLFRELPKYKKYDPETYKRLKDEEFKYFTKYKFYSNLLKELDK